jgi:hypothetical protein
MEQAQEQQSSYELAFRDYVDIAIVFGCIPALVLNVIFWAVTTAFSMVKLLDSIMALLVTLLISFIGIVLVIRYVDVCMLNIGVYNANPHGKSGEDAFGWAMGTGAACIFLAVCIIGSLAAAGALDGWHYTLMGAKISFVGYQTWRIFISRQR